MHQSDECEYFEEYEEACEGEGYKETDDLEVQEVKIEELLINCVEARPPLWDCRLPLVQRSKTIRDELWLEIYREFGEQPEFPIKYLMTKWRNLRDTYVRVKGEYESYKKSGSAAKKKKVWEFYENMSFLRDTLNHRTTIGNIVTTPLTSPDEVNEVHRKKIGSSSKQTAEMAIINAIEKINQPLPPLPPPSLQATEVNPICRRISELLSNVPQGERTLIEIKLLQVAYERARKYLNSS
ncbi:hypothetical protein JTB14_035600 [Gonioctena quinquepunctata]|nr:hypothetical protein JTB14_035600 [Gonioctena quinquepunctata]